MAKKITTFAFLLLAIILQASFLPNFFSAETAPDLILIILIFLTARKGFGEVWLMSITAGIILDFFSFYPVGINVIAFLSAILVVSFLARRFLVAHSVWKFATLIFLVIVGSIVNDLAVAVLVKLFLNTRETLAIFNWDIALKILNNILIFCIIYWPLKKYDSLKNYLAPRDILKKNVR